MQIELLHRNILRDHRKIHLTRAAVRPARHKSLHSHDFFELFWVQNGTVRHFQQGSADTLGEGDMVFLRPGQSHALQGRGENALVVTLCIHPDIIARLAERHPALDGHLFWKDGPAAQHHRDIMQLVELNNAAVMLEQGDHGTLAAESFLLPLCASLTAYGLSGDAPQWLVRACANANDIAVFREGAAGLVALTGKAHPHVSRTMRKYLGVTPSDYVNQMRMAYAARALTTDSEPISQIAADCGVPNMSHFHKLFRMAHQLTPLQYRQKFQRQIVQP